MPKFEFDAKVYRTLHIEADAPTLDDAIKAFKEQMAVQKQLVEIVEIQDIFCTINQGEMS